MNPNILTKELINFIEKLRAADYHIGATQYIAAQDLILALAARGQLPPKLGRLRTLLAPILCHSPKEQASFKEHFDNWISQFETPASTPPPVDIRTGIKLWKWAIAALAIVLISSISIYIYWTEITNLFKDETASIPVEVTIPLYETAQPVTTLPETTLDNETVPTTVPIDTKGDFSWNILLSKWYLWPTLLLFMVLLVWLWRKLPRFLTRKSTDTPSDIKKLFVEGIDDKLFQSVGLSRIAQQLRKHKPIPTTDLDITATLKKTIETAGWFTPITGTIPIRPEYLVLIDRTTFKDHQAELMNSLINQIIAEEVFVTRYYFDGDPRRCYPEQAQLAPLTLTELAERYPEHQLMIFSDGNGFINPITGEIVNWIEQFSVWTPRTLFTLEEPAQWGYREQILDGADFLIMPANEAGLKALAEQINTGIWQPYPKPFDSVARAFPDYLNERPRRWLERHTPEAPRANRIAKASTRFSRRKGL